MRNAKGSVRGYDVRTGKRLWIFHTIPKAGEFGYDTWLENGAEINGNTGVWAQMSADAELGLVYVPVEMPTGDYYGGHRPGDTLFADSLLALDSSTEQLAVAVAAGGVRWAREVDGGALASARMLPLALEGLAACGLGVRQLEAVAFGAGPGAFTGLRCACAVAQGLGFGARIPVVAVVSLMVVAEDARLALPLAERATLWVAMDARMDEVYAACYRHDGARWQVIDAPALYTLDALAARWHAQAPQVVAGSAVQAFAGRLPFGAAITQAGTRERAAALLRLALQHHADGATVDAAHAMPLIRRIAVEEVLGPAVTSYPQRQRRHAQQQ